MAGVSGHPQAQEEMGNRTSPVMGMEGALNLLTFVHWLGFAGGHDTDHHRGLRQRHGVLWKHGNGPQQAHLRACRWLM